MTDLDALRREHRVPPRFLPALEAAYRAGLADAKRTAEPGRRGRPAYGVTEDERATLARIVELRREGQSWDAVADALNGEGQRKRNGQPWTASAVWGVIRTTEKA